jgi:hypothetical protein
LWRAPGSVDASQEPAHRIGSRDIEWGAAVTICDIESSASRQQESYDTEMTVLRGNMEWCFPVLVPTIDRQ